MKKILLCGERSFLAGGLVERLKAAGHEVETFSRGEKGRQDEHVYGPVVEMDKNPHFASAYDAVINFIVISSWNIQENVEYAAAVHRFCEGHHVKNLYQMSSISVYPNEATQVDETSDVERDPVKKGVYGAVKAAVDAYFQDAKKSYAVTFIRPGLVISDERERKLDGIVKKVLPGLSVIMGNRRSSLPLVDKRDVHKAILRIVEKERPLPAYLLLENRRGTKGDFLAQYYHGIALPLPKGLTVFAASVLRALRVFNAHHLELMKGLFRTTYFDSSETEYDLQMSFSKRSAVVIGSGAMGAYTADRLLEMPEKPNVTMYDIGDGHLKEEAEAGLGSEIVGGTYTGLQKGRFFGFGGASVKWGGGILLFSDNDFANPTPFMRGIVELDMKYQDKVFKKFRFHHVFEEHKKKHGLFTRTGLWLGYFSRDLFTYFKILKRPVFVKPNSRVLRFMYDKATNQIRGIEFKTRAGKVKHAYYDQYFLCAGAFESNRIILSSGMAKGDRIHFSDHLSQRIFEIKGKQVLDGEDFQFGVQGTSLVTNRLIGEIDNVSFFVLPIFNDNFPFFQNLKALLFRGQWNLKIVWSVLRDIPSAFLFAWGVFIRRKVYVYKNEWGFNIDIENLAPDSTIRLSQELDDWGVPKLVVDFRIGETSQHVLEQAKTNMKSYLTEQGLDFRECNDVIHVEKSEDTYHPYGMFMSECQSLDDYFTRYPNLLIANTGVLPRAGGINCTAAVFPLIEEYVGERYAKRIGGSR